MSKDDRDPFRYYKKLAWESRYPEDDNDPIEAFDDDDIEAFDDEPDTDVEFTIDDVEPDRESYMPTEIGDVTYFSENELSRREIRAAIDDGEIIRWRVDASGTQWFRKIQAIPPAAEQAAASTGILDGIRKMIFGVPARDE